MEVRYRHSKLRGYAARVKKPDFGRAQTVDKVLAIWRGFFIIGYAKDTLPDPIQP